MKKKSFFYIGGFVVLSFVFIGAAVLFGSAGALMEKTDKKSAGAELSPLPPLVVIDAGHGGEDGGCSGDDGTLEKDLNLLVAKNVRDILEAAGVPALMTREDDTMLYAKYGDLNDYTGHKKVYDLKNRVRMTEESGASVYLGIHMNKFPDKKYSGLQVYYSTEKPSSPVLADRIQKYVSANLQKDNDRATKRAGDNIYVLNRSSVTAVLVECGFLSNDTERELLKDAEYRKKLSLCIACAVIDHLSVEENNSGT